jgi:hypothetical protein
MATSWATVIIFALIGTPGVLRSVALLWIHGGASGRSPSKPPPRPSTISAAMLLAWQFLLTFTLVYTYNEGGWNAELVGIRSELSPWPSFGAGIGAYFVLTIPFGLALRWLGIAQGHAALSFLVVRSFWPRSSVGRVLSTVASCVFNPITEELVYRGILVMLLGRLVHSQALAILVGLVLNLLAHSYQGARALPFHALFYFMVVLFVYSPLGLVGAFGAHFAGDLVPQVVFLRKKKEWKSYYKLLLREGNFPFKPRNRGTPHSPGPPRSPEDPDPGRKQSPADRG